MMPPPGTSPTPTRCASTSGGQDTARSAALATFCPTDEQYDAVREIYDFIHEDDPTVADWSAGTALDLLCADVDRDERFDETVVAGMTVAHFEALVGLVQDTAECEAYSAVHGDGRSSP